MLEFMAGTAFGSAVAVVLELLGIGVLLYALLGPTPSRYASGVRRAALFVAVLLVTPFLISTLVPLVASTTTAFSPAQVMVGFQVGAGILILAALIWVTIGFRRDRNGESEPVEPFAPTAENTGVH